MNLLAFLGSPAADLLATAPFCTWPVTRSTQRDQVTYEFDGQHVEFVCDEGDRIATIFLHAGVDESVSDISFTTGRGDVLARFGAPSRSGGASSHPILGESGAWDRFDGDDGVVHVQYRVNVDAIALVTLMRSDVAP